MVPERGRAEPTNRRSTNGSRKPRPDGKRRETGVRTKKEKKANAERRYVDWNRRMRKTARTVV